MYEVLWSRYLTLILGSSTYAVSIILTTFMAGLAVGSVRGGRWIDKRKNILAAYAVIELSLGLYALVLPMLFTYVINTPLFTSQDSFPLPFQRVVFCVTALAVPTCLMGATFPVMAKLAMTRIDHIGGTISKLYFLNVLGAAAGAYLAGFILIEMQGVAGTNNTAVIVNLVIAGSAYLLSRRSKSRTVSTQTRPSGREAIAPSRRAPAPLRQILLTTLFFSGLAAMAYQVLWTRILITYFSSTIYAFSSLLVVFLLAIALGGLASARLIRWRRNHAALFAITQILMGSCAILSVFISGHIHTLIYRLYPLTDTWTQITFINFFIAMLIVFPAAFFSGMSIPLLSKLQVRGTSVLGYDIGRIYFFNTLGALLGPLLAGFLLIPGIGIKMSFHFIAFGQSALGILLVLLACPIRKGKPLSATILPVSALVLVMFLPVIAWQAEGDDRQIHSMLFNVGKERYKTLYYREGVAHTVAVLLNKVDGSKLLEIDGFTAAGTGPGYAYMKIMAHLAAFLNPGPRDALVIGLGTGITAGSLLQHPISTLTVVEIDPAVVGALNNFRTENYPLLEDGRVRIVVADGRNWLVSHRQQYDLIVLEPMPPFFAGVTNLYSTEFYRISKRRLSPNGIVCQWLPLHLLSPKLLKMIVKSFRESFNDVLIWHQPGSNIALMFGSPDKIRIDFDHLSKTMSQPGIFRALKKAGIRSMADVINNFVLNRSLVDTYVRGAKPVTDNRPFLEFLGPKAMAYGRSMPLGKANRLLLESFRGSMKPRISLDRNGKKIIVFE